MLFSSSFSKLKIGIVGGSISGLTIGNLLRRLGANPIIFERSPQELRARGAGVFLPKSLIENAIQLNLFDKDIPKVKIHQRTFYRKESSLDRLGLDFWSQPLEGYSMHWGHIYKNLRKRFPNELYYADHAITSVKCLPKGYRLETNNGSFNVDFLIAADGAASIIRKNRFPESEPQDAGYIAWRGTLPIPAWIPEEFFNGHIPYYMFDGGHILSYPIPALNPNKKLLNWVLYEKSEAINQKIVGKTFSPGKLTEILRHHLNDLSEKSLPPSITRIIHETPLPFIQRIADYQAPKITNELLCFLGDSQLLLRPHSASGVTNAITNAMLLAGCLSERKEVHKALRAWQTLQEQSTQKNLLLSISLGKALVTDSPDWKIMTPDKMDKWWQDVMHKQEWYATTNSPTHFELR